MTRRRAFAPVARLLRRAIGALVLGLVVFQLADRAWRTCDRVSSEDAVGALPEAHEAGHVPSAPDVPRDCNEHPGQGACVSCLVLPLCDVMLAALADGPWPHAFPEPRLHASLTARAPDDPPPRA